MSDPDPSAAREEIGTELERVVRRWQQLPLDHALSVSPQVRVLVQHLADRVAEAERMPSGPVPDLGPAVLMDQLRVMVFDHAAAGLDPVPLAAELTTLRRAIG
ncbi:hypothetical protein NF556_17730 [Ornithinimicrobium faecis]|uniref:Uncharacterized protein n=1 Tax=Ornithinimicrobium faecis TaxID=2934158 RepID=A0ABY4YTD9_9MICO|nr:hypothetical protein [Ornithinimicrobium sp. HY1793]USQ79422.1 hypothetical protein NF556_17730 [Ornithinimicrobium sp. HY1793]